MVCRLFLVPWGDVTLYWVSLPRCKWKLEFHFAHRMSLESWNSVSEPINSATWEGCFVEAWRRFWDESMVTLLKPLPWIVKILPLNVQPTTGISTFFCSTQKKDLQNIWKTTKLTIIEARSLCRYSYFIQENEKTEDLYNPALHNKETSVTLLLCKFLVILQHQVQYINYLHVI